MKKPIRFIYFDVGNVIVNNDEAMERVARTHKVSKRDVYDIVYTHWREACLGKLSNEAYMDVFTQRLGITHPSHNMTEFWSDFQSPIPETYAFIHELSQSYRMGLLSNAENEILGLLQKKKKIPDIVWTSIIDSSQHGVVKPEARIYEIAEKAAGVPPEEIFFTDDVEDHIEMAKSRGWQGMVFNPKDVSGSISALKKILLK